MRPMNLPIQATQSTLEVNWAQYREQAYAAAKMHAETSKQIMERLHAEGYEIVIQELESSEWKHPVTGAGNKIEGTETLSNEDLLCGDCHHDDNR